MWEVPVTLQCAVLITRYSVYFSSQRQDASLHPEEKRNNSDMNNWVQHDEWGLAASSSNPDVVSFAIKTWSKSKLFMPEIVYTKWEFLSITVISTSSQKEENRTHKTNSSWSSSKILKVWTWRWGMLFEDSSVFISEISSLVYCFSWTQAPTYEWSFLSHYPS